jgi:hypothetical protein
MTLDEIERKITNGMSEAATAELWDCLYLTQAHIIELLKHVKQNAAHDWIYPVFCFAAHTGARRSEILRVLVTDVDFGTATVLLREKKRSRKQRTRRKVPLTPALAEILRYRATSWPTPAAKPTAPGASPPALPGPSPAKAAPLHPVPAMPSVLPGPTQAAPRSPLSSELETLRRMLGQPATVATLAPTPP